MSAGEKFRIEQAESVINQCLTALRMVEAVDIPNDMKALEVEKAKDAIKKYKEQYQA